METQRLGNVLSALHPALLATILPLIAFPALPETFSKAMSVRVFVTQDTISIALSQ